MKHSDFLNKPVVSINDGNDCGKVENLFFENFKEAFLTLNKQNQKLILPCKNVFAVGKKCVLVKNKEQCFVATKTFFRQVLGKQVFRVDGKSFGKVLFAWFSKKFEVEKFSTNNFSFTPKQIVSVGQFVVINQNKKTNKTNFAKNGTKIYKKTLNLNKKVCILPKK